ncbi:MAG: c-type cytochrome domain-containing protein, partial [Roseibacillus sp.]
MRSTLPWLLGITLAGAAPETNYQEEIRPLLEQYCFDCHGDGSKKGDLAMDKFKSLPAHLENQEHWLAIWRNVRSQIMPPSKEEQLTFS